MKILSILIFSLFINTAFGKSYQWACLKEDGSVAFKMEAKYVYEFSEGMAKVKLQWYENNEWHTKLGFVNANGEMRVKAEWDKVKGKGFVHDRAWVKNKPDAHWTLIDKSGNVIPTGKYDKVGFILDINDGITAVFQDGKMGFIDLESGKEIIPCKYLGSTSFHEGLACVTEYEGTDEKYGFINKKGEWVIPMQYKQAGHANFMGNGRCRATVSGSTVLINKKGEVAFKTSKGNIQGMSNGWVRVFTKSDRTGWGYLDLNDEWKIKPEYEDIESFNEAGYTTAQKDGLWGVIDTNNKVILPFKYETLYFNAEEDGFILGALPTKEPQSLMNTPKDFFTADFGRLELGDIKHIYPADGAKLMRFVDQNGMTGYMNRDFKPVIAAKYKKTTAFRDGRAWVRLN